MTELNSGTIIQAVKDDGQRTRESIRDMGQDIRDLPSNLANALAPLVSKKSGTSGNVNSGWILTTAVSVVVAVASIINGQVGPLRDAQQALVKSTNARMDNIDARMFLDDAREEKETAQLAVIETRQDALYFDRNNIYTIIAKMRTAQIEELEQRNIELLKALDRARDY